MTRRPSTWAAGRLKGRAAGRPGGWPGGRAAARLDGLAGGWAAGKLGGQVTRRPSTQAAGRASGRAAERGAIDEQRCLTTTEARKPRTGGLSLAMLQAKRAFDALRTPNWSKRKIMEYTTIAT